MWPGPYGNFGSRKYLIASCDQSLKRMGLDYVDIFYHHRPDPNTPLEETMGALDQLVRQGKALYVGISQYSAEDTAKAYDILKSLGTPLLIHQPRYSMLDRWVENGLLDVLGQKGIGSIAFSPLEQGMLTDKYLKGIPADSRAAKDGRYLKPESLAPEKLQIIGKLNELALKRGQSLAQMAIAWLLKDPRITSVLIGVSKPEQLDDNVASVHNSTFSSEEINQIKTILKPNAKTDHLPKCPDFDRHCSIFGHFALVCRKCSCTGTGTAIGIQRSPVLDHLRRPIGFHHRHLSVCLWVNFRSLFPFEGLFCLRPPRGGK